MPDYHNPAGRLLKILVDLGAAPIAREALATKLGTGSDWGSIFNDLAELWKEYELLEAAVSEFGENPHKLSQYKEDLAAIKATLESININCAGNTARFPGLLPENWSSRNGSLWVK